LPAALYVVSDDLKVHLVSEGFPAGSVGVIRNGVDVKSPTGDLVRGQVRARLRLTNDEFVVGTVGRLDPVKDLGVLIEGFARLKKRIDGARLVIVGDGVERESLAALAAKFRLSETVRFLGHREDVSDLLHAFDVYVSTSVFEGISLTLLEAMAAERPVIATAVGGTPEVVVHEVTGRLIEPRSPEAVADALLFLHRRPAVASAWGKAGRQRVLDQFTVNGMVQQYASVYAAEEL
jgi:glycosyltransferase involved in cell wall biosynthesis